MNQEYRLRSDADPQEVRRMLIGIAAALSVVIHNDPPFDPDLMPDVLAADKASLELLTMLIELEPHEKTPRGLNVSFHQD